jgi:acetyl esterase/lipase
MRTVLLLTLASLPLLVNAAAEPAKAAAKKPSAPAIAPTEANVPYGKHERHVLDFYKAKSEKPTPLLFFIHGGGWVSGDKSRVTGLRECLAAGISVVSINYRYTTQAAADNVEPPVKAPLTDAARALQFVRSKATEWNINKERIGACGGSAGACSSLWLAFHDDMAEPSSADPVARESTRLSFAAVLGAQTTLDPQQMKEWTPNSRYGGHAFGFPKGLQDRSKRDTAFAEFLANRESVLPWIKLYSPYEHVSSGDPAIYLSYNKAPNLGQPEKDPTHTANFGVKLQEHCQSKGVACELAYPGATGVTHPSVTDFIVKSLTK